VWCEECVEHLDVIKEFLMNQQLQIQLKPEADLWHTGDMSGHSTTGYSNLDAILPDGGWPEDDLVEMITPQWGVRELQLLLPIMKEVTDQGKTILWIAPPCISYAPALVSAGVDIRRVVTVEADRSCQDVLSGLETSLQDKDCGMVIAWLDWLPNAVVRRIQRALRKGHTLGVLLRQHEQKDSPAPLRLQITPVNGGMRIVTLKAQGTCQSAGAHFSSSRAS
jgi:hypothetical protein